MNGCTTINCSRVDSSPFLYLRNKSNASDLLEYYRSVPISYFTASNLMLFRRSLKVIIKSLIVEYINYQLTKRAQILVLPFMQAKCNDDILSLSTSLINSGLISSKIYRTSIYNFIKLIHSIVI